MWKFRVASAPLAGILFLFGLAVPARAGNFLHPCQSDCNTEVIKIPGNQIVVETARPQVVVNETRVVPRHKRMVTAVAPMPLAAPMPMAMPMVATIFTPMALPLAPVPVHTALAAPPPCPASPQRSALDAAHAMEAHHLEFRKLQAAHEIEMLHTQEVFKRMSATMSASLSPMKLSTNGTDSDVKAQIAVEVAKLQAQISGSNDYAKRLEGVIKELQTLVIAHDEVIKKKVLQANGSSSGCGGCDTKKLEDMIKELQKLVLRHDDVLRDLVKQRGLPVMPPVAPPVRGD